MHDRCMYVCSKLYMVRVLYDFNQNKIFIFRLLSTWSYAKHRKEWDGVATLFHSCSLVFIDLQTLFMRFSELILKDSAAVLK